MFSRRCKNIGKSPITKYNNIINEREKKGIKFYRLNIGQPDFDTDKLYFQELANYKEKVNSYCDPEGLDILRKSVSKYYNRILKKDLINLSNVVVTQGASDAIIKILYTICDCNDEVLILEPFFTDYKLYCNLLEIKFKTIKYCNININILEKNLTNKTRAILFANPNNPDGSILKKEDIKLLLDFAKKNNLIIISDEVYSGLVYSNDYISMINHLNENVVVVDSASKKLNLCGSRIGYVISKNSNLINNIIDLNDCRISISRAEQYVVSKVLNQSERIIKRSKDIYKKRIDRLLYKIKFTDIDYIVPKGGISIVLTLPFVNTENYVKWLIEDYDCDRKSLLLVSCKDFYNSQDGNNKVRVCLTLNDDDFDIAINMLIDSYQKYRELI